MKTRKSFIFLLAVIFIFVGHCGSMAAEKPIGFIKKVDANALIKRKGSSLTVQPGLPVFLYDILETDSSGAIGITFIDNTRVSLGPDTEYVIDDYAFKPRKKIFSFVSQISKGTLQFISGTLSKLSPKSVSVNTPSGTIGIRGTNFLVKVEDR